MKKRYAYAIYEKLMQNGGNHNGAKIRITRGTKDDYSINIHFRGSLFCVKDDGRTVREFNRDACDSVSNINLGMIRDIVAKVNKVENEIGW